MTCLPSASSGKTSPEHLDRTDPAVQQDQGLAFAVNLVVHFEAVYLGVSTLALPSLHPQSPSSAGS